MNFPNLTSDQAGLARTSDREATDELITELHHAVSGDVRFDAFTRTLYSTDASIYQIQPLGVVIPRTTEDVVATIEIAARHGVPVLPRGGGSGQAGQALGAAVVIDFSRHLNKIIEVNAEERWARVQPGLVHAQLDQNLAPMGLQFGPDPSSGDRATFGGMTGTNASGSHSLLYGVTVDHVKSMDCVLADGSIARFESIDQKALEAKTRSNSLEGNIYRVLTKLLKLYETDIKTGYPVTRTRSGGYNLDRVTGGNRMNLASLITGSEGTLAVVTEIQVGLVARPKRTALMVIHFDALLDALAVTPRLLEANPATVELIDGMMISLTRDVPAYARQLATFVKGQPEALLLVEYCGENERDLDAKLDALEVIVRREGISGVTVRATNPSDIARIWKVRKAGLGLLASSKGDFKPIPFIEDAAVPVDHLARYIEQIQDLCAEHDTRVAYYAHASVGLLHVRPFINLKTDQGVQRLRAIAEASLELVTGYGGAISGEHGDGLVRSEFNERQFGPILYQAFREVKRIFDPQGIMNPGKIVDAAPMTESLRYGPAYQARQFDTVYDFSADQGFDRAIEMCNGAGNCRQLGRGTMCPSFQATREEEHSTRGRANLLRSALAGLLPSEMWTSKRMFEALDLCLECKACKSECPSGVDMAKIKAEWLVHYYNEHGIPLRSRLFANIHTLSKWGSALAPLSNWGLSLRLTRWLLEKILGISRKRVMPAFARVPFHRWFNSREALANGMRRQAILFHDTFMTYNEPEIGIAATELIEAAGYEVLLVAKRVCCGRPMISKGLVRQAQVNARRNVDLLVPYAESGLPIIGCEPSCILTIRDDYPDLVPGEAGKTVAKSTYTLEEFIAKEVNAGKLEFNDKPRKILLHGHCHQKALVSTSPAKIALSAPANYHVGEIPSGCCGMAGSFGYEREHYDLSLQIGELSLLPAVREAGEDVEIVAAGTSCRHQIVHGTGRKARHPALVLREALNYSPK